VEFRILGTLEVDSEGTRGQADAYLSELATERGRAADAQRMQAYADWWLGTHR
jgi:hypothetical protein